MEVYPCGVGRRSAKDTQPVAAVQPARSWPQTGMESRPLDDTGTSDDHRRNMVAEDNVRQFYSQIGWAQDEQGIAVDTNRWDDTRSCSLAYVSRCRMRTRHVLPESGVRLLDAGSGPIQFDEYAQYSEGFKQRYCVDLSIEALRRAEERLGRHGEYINESILKLSFPDNYFDASISLHTIYHIDKDQQADAIRNLLRMTGPSASLVVVYENPMAPVNVLIRAVKAIRRSLGRGVATELYYYAHPMGWWGQFTDEADVHVQLWRTLGAVEMRTMIPNNRFGATLLDWLFRAEERFPGLFLALGRYPMIVLKKRLPRNGTPLS